MRNWVRRLISWRSGRPTSRASKTFVPAGLGFECLEDRLAPAITALPAGGVGMNMPRFPIEEEVRAATNQAWQPLTISVQSPAQGSLFNQNVAVSGMVSIANVGQVSLAVQTDGGGFVPVGLAGSQFSVPTAFALNGAADGPHTLTFLATDHSGRSATTAVTLHLDTIAPTIATFDLDPASDTGAPGDQITSLATVTLRGTTEAGSTVVLANTGASTTADASGVYSFANLDLPLSGATFQVRATDRAGNLGPVFSRTITRQTGSVAPVVTISPLVTNSTAPTLTGTVDSAATVVVTVNNQNLTATVTGNTWSVNIPGPLAAATYPITVNATNSANQTGTATNASGLIVDLTAPTLGITSSRTSPTNATSIPITFTFSEDVANFVLADISVNNGTISNLVATNARTYTATLTPTSPGVYTISVAANSVSDTAGNGIAAATFSITFDNIAPTATISSAASNPTNTSPITFTIEFSENVNDFVIGGLTATNGTLSNFVIVDGNTYRVDVTPTANGAVALSLAAGVAQDAAGNANTAATFSIASDRTAPTVNLTSSVASPTNANSFTVTATFSEDVSGVTLADFNVTGGVASALTTINNHTYTVLITPSADGATLVSLPVNSAQDSAGNGNAAGALSITVDRTAPTATITTNATNPTNLANFEITIAFNEEVSDFTAAGLTVVNGTFAAFTKVNDRTYTATVTPTANAIVTIDVAAASGHDAAGNANTVATATITSDTIAPTPIISSAISSPTTLTSIPITIQFSENVLGLVVGDFTVTNGSLTNLVATDENTYTATLIPASDGLVTVNLPSGAAQDAAGNSSEPATFSITANIPPVASITSTATNPTSAASFPITITFSKDVNNFTAAGIEVANGSLSGFATSDSKTYTATVTPTGNGLVTVTVLANAAQDSENNGNPAATFSITFDTMAPTVSFASTATNPTNLASIPLTIIFNEDVDGFTAAGLSIANGTLGTFTKVDDHTYEVTVIPSGEGSLTIDVLAAAAQDAAGNDSAAASFSIVSDRIAPTVAITSATTSPTNANSFTVTISFSEIVADFTLADIAVAQGAASDLATTDGQTYTALITPSVDGVVSVTVAAATAHDAAGNGNTAGSFALTVDRAAPTATIDSPQSSPTNQGSILIAITFSEDVVNFTEAGLTVSGGSLSGFNSVNNRIYHVALSPTANGPVTIDLLAASAQDDAGNNNVAATFTIVYDTIAPTTIISSSASDPATTSPIPITIEFSEDVGSFTAADLIVLNGTVVAFTKVDDNTYTASIAPTADGLVSVDIAAGAAQDAAGNNSAAATFSITADVGPSASISSAVASPSNATSFAITVTFTVNVNNFSAAGIEVVNGSLSGFTMIDPKTYTATITPTADGLVQVTVLAGAAQDDGGIPNTASAPFSMTRDATGPTTIISSTATDPTNLAAIPITFEFNEDVANFVASDVNVSNGTLSNFTKIDENTYTATVAPTAQGLVTVSIASAAVQDTLGNDGAAASFSITANFPPVGVVSSSLTSPTNAATIPITITFNEDVEDFTIAGLSVANGSLSNFSAVDAKTYTVTVTPTADGIVTVTLLAGSAQDSGGHSNAAATFTIVSDRSAPTLRSPITSFSVPLSTASSSGLIAGTFDDNSIGSSSVTFNITIGTTPMNITLNLLDKDAPITVANFFNYLSRYDDNGGVLFHRLHMEPLLQIIQAGGYTFNDATNTFSSHIPTDNPIFNEYSDAHPNVAGTISMARLGNDANSATSEFFFNFSDANANTLNATNGGGFAVFGSVATQADLDKLMTLSTFTIKNAGGVFNELPLVDGVTVDENNVLRITSVGVNQRDSALTYSVTSSNEAAVTVASSGFQNNFITLNYHAAGASTITITATDQAGNSTNNTFVVTVT